MMLRTRVTVVAVAVTLLAALILVAASRVALNNAEERFAEAIISGKSVLWKKIAASQLDAMNAAVTTLTRDRASRSALREGDRKALAASAKTTFNLLNASKVINRLQIADRQGRLMYSAPRSFSGKTRKSVVAAALEHGKIQRGLERDEDGALVAVLAFPLYSRGQLIGAGIYERTLDSAIADFMRNDGSQVFIVDNKGNVEYSTQENFFSRLDLSLPPLGKSRFDVVQVNEHMFAVATVPIRDGAGNPLAHLVSAEDYTASYHLQRTITLGAYGAIAVTLIIALTALYWYINRSLRPLQRTAVDLDAIAAGDLTIEVGARSKDEIGGLRRAMQRMIEGLRDILGRIDLTTSRLAESAGQLTEVATAARQGVETQRSGLEQVASSMNQLTTTAQEIARNATEAASAARAADAAAERGTRVVRHTVDSVNKLAEEIQRANTVIKQTRENSENIGSVLDVIRGVAEQTNLLALNAAIEAARAGEQGRGFAVVADEVRSLANRTQQSTDEIQQMIEQLVSGAQHADQAMRASEEGVMASVKDAAEAGAALEEITATISQIHEMNHLIASAAEEQSPVVEEIHQNVAALGQVADQSAEGIRRTSAATEQLNGLASQLGETVGRFRIKSLPADGP